MKYYLKSTTEFGRGLYANTNLEKNKELFTCELLVLSETDTIKLNDTDLKYYVFKYNETQDCLVLGLGEIFNHSDIPNIGFRLIDLDDRKVMQFYTLKSIKENEQLFTDYSSDIEVKTSEYVNKNLM